MYYNVFLFIILSISSPAHGQNNGFTFSNGYCQKNKAAGYNPNYLGECGMFTGARITNQIMNETKMTGINLNGSSLYRSEFKNIDLNFAALRRGRIIESQFTNIEAKNLDLRGSWMKGVHWQDSNLYSWVATGARIEKSKFINCDLRYSTFWGADLQESDFSGSDLRWANLESTHILFAKFNGAKFNSKTLLPFSEEEALKRGMIKVD